MKHPLQFVVAITFAALFSGVALSQRYGGADSVQNNNLGTPQSSYTAPHTKPSFPQPNWMVKYISGSLGLKSDQWLRIAFVPRLASAQIANASLNVPADQLVAVEFNAKTEKESDLLQAPRSGCSYARSMMPDTTKSRPGVLIVMPISPGPVSRLAESLRSKHPVRFVWNEAGEHKSMIVTVNDCEYESFIANLRWVVGARWQEIGHELKK
jgi:hypothetical protein